MPVKIQSIIATGTQGTLIDIECHLSNNLPNIVIVGYANRAVDEARERLRGAFATSRIRLPRKRIIINLAPADLPKSDSSFDLAMAVGILTADGQLTTSLGSNQVFIGELGLDGSVRGVRGLIGKLLIGRARGINRFYIPAANLSQARLIPGIELVPIASLSQLYGYLAEGLPTTDVIDTGGGYAENLPASPVSNVRLSQIVGQDQAKYALKVAAAGGHNIYFNGPPGTGKSMLARALPSLLPALSLEEMLEVTHLHSLASHDYEQIIARRPFRAPHHSASFTAITGGGPALQPGEISLAHRGVLFFDELPEFDRDTVEALRQPLEDRTISIARAHGRADYPANFIFVATGNPCPCGYAGTGGCKCIESDIRRYQSRLSGPIIDRVDIHSFVGKIDHGKLLTQHPDPATDQADRSQIARARLVQSHRFKSAIKLNADMTNDDIKALANLTPPAARGLNKAANKQNLSVRAYMCAIRVARTLADLDESATITTNHVTSALRYRHDPPQGATK